jgi:Tropinone reductase 1
MNRWRLDGKCALVSGASRGIGFAIARELAQLGADLIMLARGEDALERAASELREEFPARSIQSFSVDVADAEGRAALHDWLLDEALEFHALVNNVGDNRSQASLAYSAADIDAIMRTNTLSAFEMARLGHQFLSPHGDSAIVNIASVSGLKHVRTGSVYGMSKAALVQLTRNLAVEWAADGIRVNAIAPWYTRTVRTQGPLSNSEYFDEVLERTPLGRIAECEEVAGAAAFLCLPAASYITGVCLPVDGGFSVLGF